MALEMRDIRMTLRGKVVHDGVNFAVREGEIMTLVGGSGQGKSVLLKEVIGLMRPDSGSIFVHGREVTAMDEVQLQQIRREVAIVFQGSALFDSLTVGENVAYGLLEHNRYMPRKQCDETVADMLAVVDLPGIERLMPSELSGGMKKRVAIARALALTPRVILYDEPTTGLDPANVRRVNDLIVRMRDRMGITSLLVTHDVQVVQAVTDRLALLDRGRIIAVGAWHEMEHSHMARVREFLEGKVETDA